MFVQVATATAASYMFYKMAQCTAPPTTRTTTTVTETVTAPPTTTTTTVTETVTEFTMEEVAKHNKENDCWVVVDGKVYDVTNFLTDHPGGKDILLKQGGKDATEPFKEYHSYENIKGVVDKHYIGDLLTKAKTTIPSVTTSRQTAVINLPLNSLWKLIRSCTFEWQKSLVAKTDTIGSSKIIHYLDKTQQTIQVTEVSDRDHRISWSMVSSEPAVTYSSRDDTICLTAITVPDGAEYQTLIEWNSEFSNDATIDVIMDGNLKKHDAFNDLSAK